jgi:pSer/pThr/pTyr-binding forkhead associated (FHA) protein
MDQVIWVEILDRHRAVLMRQRCAGPVLRIGRAYDNDVVIDDPFVAAHHLRIFIDESGALVAEDLGSANGLFADHSMVRQNRLVLDGEHAFRIGKTLLRARSASHPIAAERMVIPQQRTWPLTLGLAAAILTLEALDLWLTDTSEPKLTTYILPLLSICAIVLAWVGFCAVLSRIFAGHAMFERNLRIALTGLLALSLLNEVLSYGAFGWNLPALTRYDYVGLWIILASICFFHLCAISPARLWVKGGGLTALAVIAIATTALSQSESRSRIDEANYVKQLKPPQFRLAPARTESGFFQKTAALKESLDRARTEETIDGGAASADLD